MAKHVSATLIGGASLIAAQFVSQLGAPTWFLGVTIGAFLVAALLIEMLGGKRRAFALATVTVAYMVVAVPVLRASQHPRLADRYAESWEVRPSGASIEIDESTVLPSRVGKHQMFTPAVRAPITSPLSNAWLSVCLPVEFTVDAVNPERFQRVWTLQETTPECGNRYTTTFKQIPRGGGLNVPEALHFRPSRGGEIRMHYSISSDQYEPYSSYFTVIVMP